MTTSSDPVFADVHLLVVLAQTRSYTQAARRLGISKASVSMRIADLERAAGMPLVQRTTRSVALTAAGQQLAAETELSFTRIAQSFTAVRDLASTPRGLVRVTAPVALGRQHMTGLIAGFLQRYPEIRIELDLTDRFVNLAQEGFDLAIRHTHAPPDTHVAWTLCETRSLLVATGDYLARRGMPTHPSELVDHDCLLYLRDGAQAWSFARAAGGGRRAVASAGAGASARETLREPVRVPVAGPFKANNSEALRDAVLCGLGIGLLPDFSASEHLRTKAMQAVMPEWQPQGVFGDRIHAIRPWSPHVPRAVQCLVDHLREHLAKGFPVTE